MYPKRPSSSQAKSRNSNAYKVIQRAGIFTLLAAFGLSVFPHSMDGFLPTPLAHADNDSEPPILHDPNIALLEAATNSDPHTDKGGNDILLTGNSALLANVGASGEGPEIHDHDAVGGPSITQSEETGGEIKEYKVKEGDTLSEIAEAHGVSTKTLLWANDLSNANSIRPGDTLVILPVSGIQYTIKSGDTLSTLAKRYDVDSSEILSYNKLSDDATLTIGQSLIIPGGELQAASKAVAVKSGKSSATIISSGKTALFSSSYFTNPLPSGKLSQSTHGYNAADVAAPSGTPILAAADGTILISKDGWNGGYGNYIVVKHDNGTQTLYAHMTSRALDSGTVSAGDVIGYVGSTGKSTGNHLHFEVRGGKNPFAL